MSLILNIDTATEAGHVSIAKDAVVLKSYQNELQKDHASFLQPVIQQLCTDTGIELKNLDAIAVTGGPGSYTGLRVGLASAKGLCYALSKPLIMLNTLEVLTASALPLSTDQPANSANLFCPMIDARRMEVFTAIYDNRLATILSPRAMILDEQSFQDELRKNKIIFFGSGSYKWAAICRDPNALFETVNIVPEAMARLSFKSFSANHFADTAYSEPFYLKEFQTITRQ
jgi:tRNA threonylcarbamoyladenosine biosynthesis protein TsaB